MARHDFEKVEDHQQSVNFPGLCSIWVCKLCGMRIEADDGSTLALKIQGWDKCPMTKLPVTKQADRIALMSVFRATIAVLRWTARMVCNRKNCGTVCKCEPCMAREALEFFDPEWRP